MVSQLQFPMVWNMVRAAGLSSFDVSKTEKRFVKYCTLRSHIDATVHSRVYVDVAFRNSNLSNENRGNNLDPGLMCTLH